MAIDNSRPDVAVFIDFENVYVSVRDKLDANPNFESIMDRCEDLGRVVIARAYADWYRYPRVTSALYANSIEPMYVPTYYYDRDLGRTGRAIKNSVDMNLCVDAMKTLFTNPNIAKFVLATGDRDFIPLVNTIRQQGKEVIVIGIGGAASSHLAQSADEFIFYEALIGKKPSNLLADLPRAKMPAKGREQEPDEFDVQPPARETRQPEPRQPEPRPAEPRQPEPRQPEPSDDAVYDVLVQAVGLARERGYVCSFGSLKLLMKELMGGEFRENRYRDLSGKPFAKFKDFVLDAERRNKVQVFTNGTVNEVFLPGEDPYKLSQFAQELKEEPTPLEVAAADLRIETRAPLGGRQRRRRRPRGGQRQGENGVPLAEVLDDLDQVSDTADLELDVLPTIIEEPISSDDEFFSTLVDQVEAEDQSLEQVDDAALLSEPLIDAEAPAEILTEAEDASVEEVPTIGRPFDDADWDVLSRVVAVLDRPVSFVQIHDALRDARNRLELNRTNEELRTLIKQAINTGLLQRSGKGTRIVYRLAVATPEETTVEAVSAPAVEDFVAPVVEGETAEPLAELTAESDLDLAEAPATEPLAELLAPSDPEAEPDQTAQLEQEIAPVEEPKKKPSRRKKTEPIAEVAAVAVVEEPKKKPSRRKKTEPVAESLAEVVAVAEASTEEPKKKPARRRKKTEPAAEPASDEA